MRSSHCGCFPDRAKAYPDVHVRGRPGTETYAYDGNGTLLKRAHYAAGSSTPISWTRYVGGLYELHSDGTYTKYYQGLGRTVAIRTGPAAARCTTRCSTTWAARWVR
jgi:hypothetical protein